ncbi:PCNA-interacting partner isoform X2 [Petaurus breviceps papuanus]|uniref:PCNA-interacting partner isoform X2 n=1 Tax=Petaurus breviceps papuanus TaxID=3040969 RepID=UPI0036D81BD2
MAPLSEAVLDMIKSLRRNWHSLCPSERTTVCDADFMLEALQLSMAEINKEHSGEFTVSLSDVLLAWNHLLHDKLDLPCEDMEMVEHYKDIRKTYDAFLKNSNIFDLTDVYRKCQTLNSTCENKVMSPVQSIARKIICSYLSLLVNSKNDLALAHIINIPDRGLGREAFTDLKHAAREKQMSVFLVATSFIRMIELGGKGYAPSPSDPLRTHGKGLNNFIIFMDKLEEILGEIPNPRIAGGRILSVIKTELIKGRSSGDAFRQAMEEVTQDLDLRIKNIINSQQEDRVNTTGSSPVQPKSYAINHGTAYCGRDTVKVLLLLLDEEASNPPSENKADLLYGDEDTTSYAGTPMLTLFSSPTQSNELLIKPLRERIQKSMEEKKIKMKQTLIRSQFACTYKDDFLADHERCSSKKHTSGGPACEPHLQDALPEGTSSFDGVPTLGTSSGNIQLDRSKNEKLSKKSSGQTGNKGPKRKQVDLNGENGLCDCENELSWPQMGKIPKTSSIIQNKSNQILARSAVKGSKPAPKNKLIAGQAKLTQFFRL